LRDFGYELFGRRDEIDDKILIGPQGVVKVTHTINRTSLLHLDGFAPASQWEEFSATSPANLSGSEVAR